MRKQRTEKNSEINKEMSRLIALGLSQSCVSQPLRHIAELTLKINNLKKEKKTIVCAHVYQLPEVILGIGDMIGDSYKLAADTVETDAENIIFCGVHFMAETAKILNPEKKVYIPSKNAGCTLAESIKAEDVKKLKLQYPNSPVVTYINTTAEVKAESDCIVTSANAEKILRKMYQNHKRVIFVPDKFMGANLAKILGKTIGKDMILWDGTCIVHKKFDARTIKIYRDKYPGLAVLAHAECPPELIDEVDFAGGTGAMMKYVENTNAAAYLLITECGFGELAKIKFPDKNFVAMCRLCPYMKSITLNNVLDILENPSKEFEINVPADMAEKAKKSIDKMFELV
ncbi:MAG: quinolinate synthase NadA [Elusimicrobia bacterium]|nr:quinolinate synthase NadA [Elusimicrobiota bacterium]